MRALILCAGDGTRWGNYLGVPKWLAPIDGIPILHRTVTLLRARGVTDIRVVAKPGDEHTAQVAGAVVERARLDPTNFEADRFRSSRHLWSDTGRTIILYGDVYYTDAAMDTIVSDQTHTWRVYGRPKASTLTGCTHGELFGFSWWPPQHPEVDDRLGYVIGLRRSGVINRALGWELFRALCGRTGRDVRRPAGTRFHRLVIIQDWTDDFDKPKNYDTWLYRRNAGAGDVAVLVPFRSDGGHRDEAWAWAWDRWTRKHPTWQVVEGSCPDGPWSKGTALADALTKTTARVLVLADADVWCPAVAAAVDKVATGQNRWAIPHRDVRRLSEAATASLLAGRLRYDQLPAASLAEPAYRGYAGGGITVIHRDLLTQAPIDPRFTGWGQEDQAAAIAWTALGGRPWRGTADLYHLWHPPPARKSRTVGSSESAELFRRYRETRGQMAAVRDMIGEFAPSIPLRFRVSASPSSVREVRPMARAAIFVSTKYSGYVVPTIGVRFAPDPRYRHEVAEVRAKGAVAYLNSPFMARRGIRLATGDDLVKTPEAAAAVEEEATSPRASGMESGPAEQETGPEQEVADVADTTGGDNTAELAGPESVSEDAAPASPVAGEVRVEHVGRGWWAVIVDGETVAKVRGEDAARTRAAELANG
jgi:hypothetical protein